MRDDERGAQALEFSLIVPAVLLLALVVAAVGQVVLGMSGTHQLAVTAARTAAVHHDDAVHAVVDRPGVTGVHISPSSGARRPGDLVTVTVTRTIPITILSRGVQVSAHATYRTEDVP